MPFADEDECAAFDREELLEEFPGEKSSSKREITKGMCKINKIQDKNLVKD